MHYKCKEEVKYFLGIPRYKMWLGLMGGGVGATASGGREQEVTIWATKIKGFNLKKIEFAP